MPAVANAVKRLLHNPLRRTPRAAEAYFQILATEPLPAGAAAEGISRSPALFCSAVLLLLAACSPGGGSPGPAMAALPASVEATCEDAPPLRQQSADAARQAAESRGDQSRIVHHARANFLASLAVLAELRCSVTAAEADGALDDALRAASSAAETPSFYEQAHRWSDANAHATRAIDLLVRQLPPPEPPRP
jgi:hypothetical protein